MARGHVLWLFLLVGVASCTLEERAEIERRGGQAPASDTVGVSSPSPAADSARAVVESFRDALRLGDVSRVGQLSTPEAVLVDQEEGVRWTTRAGGQVRLPDALLAEGAELEWVLDESTFTDLGHGGLLVNVYHAAVAGEDVPWTAVETFVLVRTSDGWRIRHLHRSRGTGEDGRGL